MVVLQRGVPCVHLNQAPIPWDICYIHRRCKNCSSSAGWEKQGTVTTICAFLHIRFLTSELSVLHLLPPHCMIEAWRDRVLQGWGGILVTTCGSPASPIDYPGRVGTGESSASSVFQIMSNLISSEYEFLRVNLKINVLSIIPSVKHPFPKEM